MAALVSVTLVIALLIATAATLMFWQGRTDRYRRADAASVSMLQAISRDLDRDIGSYDASLHHALGALQAPEFGSASGPVRRQMLFAERIRPPASERILITDDRGQVLYASDGPAPVAINIADTPCFKGLLAHPELDVVLSPPFRPFGGNEVSIALARRIIGADGQFAGVAVATIRLQPILDRLHIIAAGTNESIGLLNQDGILIARDPAVDGSIARAVTTGALWPLSQKTPYGAFDATSVLDGVPRHFRFARVGDLPLVLVIGTALNGIYAGWWPEVLTIGSITLTATVLLLGLACALYLELARRRRAETTARESADQFRMIADNVSDIIARLDLDGVRSYVSPSVKEVLGFTPEEMLAVARWVDFVHPDDRPVAAAALAALRGGTEHMTVVYRACKKDGAEVWLEARIRLLRDTATAAPREMIAVTRDVTARYTSEQELKRLAGTDGLTALGNRRTFDETLDKEWRRAMRAEERIALLMLDADYFKPYNDRYGHQAGDDVLRTIAGDITARIRRAGDTATRYGGEEFAVLLPGTDMSGAAMIAEQIRRDIQQRAIPHEDSPLGIVSISVGVACLLVTMGDDSALLVQQADMALYEAKRTGRNRVVPASPTMIFPVR
jgi:diguanylate cyclase (GGDEF)-like protein/PAS domain S-box-containing protein